MYALNIAKFIVRHPLGSRHKIRCLRTFFSWQVASRLSGEPTVFPFVDHARLHVAKQMTAATGNLYVGLHEFEDMALLLHLLRKDDLFVDVGANIGSYTVLASGVIGAHTIAFEPVPETIQWLERNIHLNGIESLVEIRRSALGSAPGTKSFTVNRHSSNRVATEADDRSATTEVPIEKLDDVLAGRCPTLIKIDVEGFEAAVLAGAERTLSDERLRCVIVEFNGSGREFGYDEGALRTKMHALDFREYGYRPFERHLEPIGENSADNVLMVRDTAWVTDRLRTARPFSVLGEQI